MCNCNSNVKKAPTAKQVTKKIRVGDRTQLVRRIVKMPNK